MTGTPQDKTITEKIKPQNLENLVPLLKCTNPSCSAPVEIIPGAIHDTLPSIELTDIHLECTQCHQHYPVTIEHIPIMWDDDLKKYLLQQDHQKNALSTNIEIYNQKSDIYHTQHRLGTAPKDRVIAGLKQLDTNSELNMAPQKIHLDWGCGPGLVIHWLEEFDLMSIGLDVSIANLRNLITHTNGYGVMGSATNMPFSDNCFDVVTEGSTLHHIDDWKQSIQETCRVCKADSLGIVFDSEPTKEGRDWNLLTRIVFDIRFYVYYILSYFMKSKARFRDLDDARRNYWEAEIHNQPGKGFDIQDVEKLFFDNHFHANIILSPKPDLTSGNAPDWKSIVLHGLSFHNPWNPVYGGFTVVANGKKI